jgi:hypothetical protein
MEKDRPNNIPRRHRNGSTLRASEESCSALAKSELWTCRESPAIPLQRQRFLVGKLSINARNGSGVGLLRQCR